MAGFETYNPRTGITTFGTPTGLSSAQQATLNEGVATQAKVNANNYNIMQSAGATPQQTLDAMGGTRGATTVSGLNATQNATLAAPLQQMNAGIMSNPAVVQAVDKTVTSAMPSAVLAGQSKTEIPSMKAVNENLAMDAFNKNYVQGQVGAAPKIVQPTGQEGYLKMRDITAEQKGISLFESTQGRKPASAKDWALINNAIYGQSTPPLRGGTLPGAKGDGGITDHVPPPEVAGPDGTIDQTKLMSTAEQELNQTKSDLEAAYAESDAYNTATQQGQQNIGQQLGVVAPLLQGEALALDQQRALGAKTLEIKLTRLENKKAELKQEVAQYRQDQQQAFVNFMNLATKTGLSSKAMTPEMLKAFDTQSKLTGIPTAMYAQSLDAIYQSRIASEALDAEQVKASIANTKFNQGIATQNLQLDRSKFSSDQAYREAQIALDYAQLDAAGNPATKPITDLQRKANGYATRMTDANTIIAKYEKLGSELIGAATQYAPNILKSADRQAMEQAQRNFINAVLRQESGAAIAPTEFDSAKLQYFPQPGDSQKVIDQKRANRQTSINGMLGEAGTVNSSTSGISDGDFNW